MTRAATAAKPIHRVSSRSESLGVIDEVSETKPIDLTIQFAEFYLDRGRVDYAKTVIDTIPDELVVNVDHYDAIALRSDIAASMVNLFLIKARIYQSSYLPDKAAEYPAKAEDGAFFQTRDRPSFEAFSLPLQPVSIGMAFGEHPALAGGPAGEPQLDLAAVRRPFKAYPHEGPFNGRLRACGINHRSNIQTLPVIQILKEHRVHDRATASCLLGLIQTLPEPCRGVALIHAWRMGGGDPQRPLKSLVSCVLVCPGER